MPHLSPTGGCCRHLLLRAKTPLAFMPAPSLGQIGNRKPFLETTVESIPACRDLLLVNFRASRHS
jgi:hypothetical protein